MSEYIDFNEILVNEDVLSQVDLSEIIDWCQKGEYKKCMELSASKLTEGYFDIRLVCYYLFGLCCKNFNEHAIYAFDSLHFILLERYQALQPHKFKSRQIESALAWFINGVLDNLSYQESHKSRLGIAEDVVNAFNLLVECMMQLAPNLQDAYKKLQHFLQQRLAKTDQGESCQHDDEHKDSPTMAEDRKALGRQVDAIALKEASPKWFDLLAKLETFNLLKAQGDTIATAAMYHHLYKELSQFNPLQYFPSVFIGFYQQSFDPKFQALVNHMNDNLNSLQWSILENIIHSDHRLLLEQGQALNNDFNITDKTTFNALIANKVIPTIQEPVNTPYVYDEHQSKEQFEGRESLYSNEFITQN